jgi:small subunit ribosomal protein S9
MEIFARAVGRRKEAIAQVQIVRGTGQFLINNKPAQEYLQNNSLSMLLVKSPFEMFQNPENSTNLEGLNSDLAEVGERQRSNGYLGSSKTEAISGIHLNFDQLDTIVKVKGGGLVGQAEAIKLGIARAISMIDYSKTEQNVSVSEIQTKGTLALEIRKQLKTKGYLTRDSRVKERRKYGLKKARKASQYHKR